MSFFSISQYDRLPVVRGTLEDANGAVNLSGYNVYFVYKGKYQTGTNPVTGVADVISNISGICEYSWTTGDVITPGIYYAQWKISGSLNGKWSSFPNDSWLRFTLTPIL